MEALLLQLAGHAPYVAVIGVLLLSGLGLPLPEDIPLIVAGYLCGQGYTNPWVMFPGAFMAILGADGLIFVLGRRYGHHVPRLPLLRRFLTEQRLARTEQMLHRHGGKFIFMARFLPGLRTAAFFTAGGFKIPYWKFFLFDGSAALLSVPAILLLAYAFSHQIHQVSQWVADGQAVAIGGVLLGMAGFVGGKWFLKKRRLFRLGKPRTPRTLISSSAQAGRPRRKARAASI
ncbi:MAG TPA: DedA family protein [Phycisphaeraceae bacterium]